MALSGFGEKFAAPYQKVFTSFGSAIDLAAQSGKPAALCSGMIVKCTTSGNLVWKDDSGDSNTLALVVGDVFDLPFAAASLEISTFAGWVLVYWHGTTADYGARLGLGSSVGPRN